MAVTVTLTEGAPGGGSVAAGSVTLEDATSWEYDNHGYLDLLNVSGIVATFHRDHWRDVQMGSGSG